MPPIKQNQVIDKSVEQAFVDINAALKVTLDSLGLIVAEGKKVSDTLANSKGIKDFNKQVDALNKNRKEASELTTAQLNLLAKEDILKKKAADATKAQQLAIQAKNKTQTQERKELERLAKEEAKQLKATAQLTSAYARKSKKLNEARKAAKDLGVQYGVSSSQFNKAAKAVNKLNKELVTIDAKLGQHQRKVGNYTQGIRNLLGAFGVVGGVQLFVKAMTSAFNISKKYEKQNAELASVLGKTRKETKLLQDESKRLGSSTAFSASQVTELQTELARLGKSEAEIIDSTEGIINATIALGSETGETAALVGATLNAFQLEAKESGRVADVLTLATQKSALSFEKLNTALPTVSGAAAAAGVSFETMVAQLGQAADRGIDASTAATSLRNIYITLAEKGLTLNDAMIKINTSQDKLSTATELFGKRTAVTALALADTTDKTKELTSSLEDAGGTAKRVADEQLNTLDGRLKLLNSAWEGLILNIGNSDTALGGFANKTVKFATNALTGLANIGLLLKTVFSDIENLSEQELGQLINAATLENGEQLSRKLSELVDKYKLLPDVAKEAITLNQFLFEGIVAAGEKIDDARVIADFYTQSLNEQAAASDKSTVSINKNEVAIIDLIKVQEDLLKLAKELPGSTEDEIRFRNDKIAVINNEITRLKELRTLSKDTTGLQKMQSKEVLKVVVDGQKEIDMTLRDGVDNFEAIEKLKTQIAIDESKKREDVEKEFLNQSKDLAVSVGNAIFESKSENLTKESERIAEEYNNRLAIEGIDEEQRSAIEAERKQEEDRLAAEQRDIEQKQFLFNQGVKAAEIGVDTATKVAGIKANIGLLLSNPITAPYAAFASAQIPFVVGTGAAAIGTVLAETIPQFDKGTKSAPKGGFIAGEKRTEIGEHKGKSFLIDTPTYFGDDYAGMKITGGAETADILEQATRSQVVNIKQDNKGNEAAFAALFNKHFEKHSNKMISAIKANKPTDNTNVIKEAKRLNKYKGW